METGLEPYATREFSLKDLLTRYWLATVIVTGVIFALLLTTALRISASNRRLQTENRLRMAAENEACEKETLLRKTQAIAHIGSWHLNLQTQQLCWSEEAYRIFGVSPENHVPSYHSFLSAVHPDDRDRVNQAYLDTLENNTPYDVTHRLIRPDGSVRIVQEKGENIFDENGKVTDSIGILHDTQQRKHQLELEHLATHDALTQLPNHNLLTDRLDIALAHTLRTETLLAVVYLDLDNFKPVNDSLGHAAGDELLIEIADRLTTCIRANDTAARLGGDEFVLLLSDIKSMDECEETMQRIQQQIAAPASIQGHSVQVVIG